MPRSRPLMWRAKPGVIDKQANGAGMAWLRELLVLACLGGLGIGLAATTEGYEFFAPVFAAEVAVAGFAALRWI